jgi:chromosome partitioning protein
VVLNTIIPRNVRLAEAPSYGQSIVDYDIKSIGAEAFLSLSGEFIRKFEK